MEICSRIFVVTPVIGIYDLDTFLVILEVLICLLQFLIHLKLELLMQFPASNDVIFTKN